ncbi:hypothetical protein V2J09_014247 [Rumex salicifolius]
MEKESCNEAKVLHTSHVHKSQAAFTKLFTFIYSILIFFFISFRLSSSSHKTNIPFLPWLLVFSSEIVLFFLSFLNLSYRFRPVFRTAFPSNLQAEELPAIDVFIFTADPEREPPLEVVNTVISAMALDYPMERLAVYISDDGGSPVTLAAAKEAVEFARWWVPFCRKYEVMTRCPKAYFGSDKEEVNSGGEFDDRFLQERRVMEEKYELFKERVKRFHNSNDTSRATRPTIVQIINSSLNDASNTEEDQIPKLIYVSREKSPLHAHHFKAGAVNALLRVSSVITNAPYVLMLDCDMYSNDPTSARQAMCFHLDPEISPSLAFVQFPQKFHNLTSNDIYGSRIRTTFDIKWPGMDGFKGPMVSGTCFYMKRRALYGSIVVQDADFATMRKHFGPSIELIKSLQNNNNHSKIITQSQDDPLLLETEFLASCAYEQNTSWGHELIVEDYFTGFKLHCKGWNSVYCNPLRPAFLGTATTNLSDALVQNTRWQSGLIDVTLSKNFPLVYGPMRMSLMQSLCYASLGLQPFYSFPIWCLATIPQLCLIHGIAIYPKASSPWFKIFLSCFMAPKLNYLQDIISTGGSVQDFWNEDRMWMIRSVTSYIYGIIDAVLKKAGLRQASFIPTNKVDIAENVKLHRLGKFNFQLPPMFLIPLVSIAFLNVVALVVGVARVIMDGSFGGSRDELIGQILLSGYVSVAGYPIIHGAFLRTDKGRIRASIAMASTLFCLDVNL